MIKYNNKETSPQEIRLDCYKNNRSKEYLARNIKNIVKSDQFSSNDPRGSNSQSPQQRQKDKKNYSLFPERRSKSHKINYQKFNRSKLKNELKKRECKASKMDLLVILPNESEANKTNYRHFNESLLDHMFLNKCRNDRLSQSNAFQVQDAKLQKKDQNKSTVRGDIAIGKMRLLAHKSKLSPIRQKSKDLKLLRQMHKSQEKLNDIEKIQTTCYKNFIKQRQIFMREHLITNENNKLSPAVERYLKISSQVSQVNLINIQSIVPNISLAEKLTLHVQTKQRRRTTEPNLDTAEQFYRITQDNFGTIYDKKLIECISNIQSTKNQFNFSRGKQRLKNYPQKIKGSQWKKKIFLSNLTKFILPYQTYYYRDMLWKINYSNKLFVEPPLEYEHRLKAYVGKGNNSSMVRGLISRRYWFAITDRIQQANFVWTKLKQFRYFNTQKKSNNQDKDSSQKVKYGTYEPKKLLLEEDTQKYKAYCERNKAVEEHSDQRMLPRLKYFSYSLIIRGQDIKESRLHNHLINNYIISNKKSLFKVLNTYYKHHSIDPFNVIPITYHVCNGIEDPIFLAFQRFYHQQAKSIRKGESNRRNYWIVKPGQNSNRGNGIKLCFKLSDIKAIVRQKGTWGDGSQKTFIIQSYIENPLLYYKRKFDIRHYMLLTYVNGYIKGYWYNDGYVRTTSSQYTLEFNGSNVHLTNDAIQKYLPNYGKYQKGNKLSYDEIDAYVSKKSSNHGFYRHIYPQMRKIAIDIMKASANYLDPNKLSNNFQLFGLDYMIDDKFNVWLIEVNSNPCLELSCPLLSTIIPNLIENVLELTMDAHFPPAVRYCAKMPRYLARTQDLNKFQLVFDERVEQMSAFEETILDNNLLQEKDDQFQDNNSEWEDNV